MRAHTLLRAVGVISVVGAYGVYSANQPELTITSLGVVMTAIIALITPEVLDQLPWGPDK